MKVKVYDGHFTRDWVCVEVPFKNWLKLVLLGEAYLRHDMKPGWRDKLPFYIVRCLRHGYFLDYPQGWDGVFYCPLCEGSHLKLGFFSGPERNFGGKQA